MFEVRGMKREARVEAGHVSSPAADAGLYISRKFAQENKTFMDSSTRRRKCRLSR
jgi:hypothetical protein